MANKKVSYTPRAPITNWNITFCMQSNCPGSSFSTMYHKSNTSLFLNSFWENSTNLSLYTDASRTLGFGGFSAPSGFRVNGLPHQTLNTKNISIDWQELYAILVASYIWAPLWAQKRIVFYCNNRFQQTSFQRLAPHADHQPLPEELSHL